MANLHLVGLPLALGAIMLALTLDGGTVLTLWHGPALLIVFGGTLGATLLQTPFITCVQAIKSLARFVSPRQWPWSSTERKLVRWSETARNDGLLALERDAQRETDPFLHLGLNLLVDGANEDQLRQAMEAELDLNRERGLRQARVFEQMAGYSPTIGIVGAVIGLIQALGNLSQPEMLGPGIASAFIATLYGVGLANLLFMPLANRLKAEVEQEAHYQEMVLEGLLALGYGYSPRLMASRLQPWLDHR